MKLMKITIYSDMMNYLKDEILSCDAICG